MVISGEDWIYLATGLCAAGSILLFYNYTRSAAAPSVRIACGVLKWIALAALLFCLLDPLTTRQQAKPGANYLALLADNSQSMQIKDRGQQASRAQMLSRVLTNSLAWQQNLAKTFELRRYLFDSHLQFISDFAELNYDGRSSALISALRSLAGHFRGQPVAGVVLFSDGNATDLQHGALDVTGWPPIYPVIIGSDDPIPDLSIQRISASEVAFEDSPVQIDADISTVGFNNREIICQLSQIPLPGKTNSIRTASPRKVTEQTLRADAKRLTARFQVRPEATGITFYRLRIAAANEIAQFGNPNSTSEATWSNNERLIAVNRGAGAHPILYVSGRPNWEFKFLQRALAEDDQLRLSALIRIAKREPKFDFKGRAGESSNPLYRGFADQDQEKYDQPVIIPIHWSGPAKPAGFPKTAEDLYPFEAVIIDDLEAAFFTRDQLNLLEKFVSERGGSVLMLGGQESLAEGQYDRTPVGQMLPVYLTRYQDAPHPQGPFHLLLTREGWLQPWARLRSVEAEEKKRLDSMPAFNVLNPLQRIKPGASVIAQVKDNTGKIFPALATQRFGNGRSAVLAIGDFWRWGFENESLHQDMDKAWRQLIRWLVASVPSTIQFTVEPSPDDPSAVRLQVRVRDKLFQPLENSSVQIRVHHFSNSTNSTAHPDDPAGVPIATEASSDETGLYQAAFVPRDPGGYWADATVTDPNGVALGQAQAAWTSEPAADEFSSLQPNQALLADIARRTGGECITLDQLDRLVKMLPSKKAPITETIASPLWHRPSIFLLAVGCLLAEWGFRRWKGLP